MRHIFSNRTLWICTLTLAFAFLAGADSFKVKKASIKDVEGGLIQIMVLETDSDQISFLPLYGYVITISEGDKRIDFKSPDGKISCSLCLTNTFAGTPPQEEQLRKQAEALYPGSSILQTGDAVIPTGNGKFVDVFRVLQNGARVTTRHTYCPIKNQTLEIIFTTDSKSFEKNRRLLSALLTSIKTEPVQGTLVPIEAGK